MEGTGYWSSLLFGRYKGDSLEGIIQKSGDFAGSSLQEAKPDKKTGAVGDNEFSTGLKDKFYDSGEVAYKQAYFLNNYAGAAEDLAESMKSALGGLKWFHDAEMKAEKLDGNKTKYTITKTTPAVGGHFHSGNKDASVELIVDSAANTIDCKFAIVPQKVYGTKKDTVLPMHYKVIAGYLNKVYHGFAKNGNLQFAEAKEPASNQDAQPETQPKTKQEGAPGGEAHEQHGAPTGGAINLDSIVKDGEIDGEALKKAAQNPGYQAWLQRPERKWLEEGAAKNYLQLMQAQGQYAHDQQEAAAKKAAGTAGS
ncbi:MAG: hypothetical protein V1839_00310 [archaeon]